MPPEGTEADITTGQEPVETIDQGEETGYGLPPLTPKERADWFGPEKPAGPAFAFEYDGKKFGSQDELSSFIKSLQGGTAQPAKPAGSPEDVSAIIAREMARERQAWERTLEERLSGRGGGSQAGRGEESKSQTNPFDPDTEMQQWHKWEMDNLAKGLRADFQKQVEDLGGRYGNLENIEAERQARSFFESVAAKTAAENRFDSDLVDLVKDMTLNDPTGAIENSRPRDREGNPSGPANPAIVQAEMVRIHREIKGLIDSKVEKGIQNVLKKTPGIPPTVLKGGGAPVTRMTPLKKELPAKLEGKHSGANMLRQLHAMSDSGTE